MAGFLNYSKAGKGIKKEDLEKSGLGLYFDIFGRRIWKLITLNLMYILVSIPAILIAWGVSSYLVTFLMTISKGIPFPLKWQSALFLIFWELFLRLCRKPKQGNT